MPVTETHPFDRTTTATIPRRTSTKRNACNVPCETRESIVERCNANMK